MWAVLGVTLLRYWNWVVSVCECCVLVLEVCVCKLCLERDYEVKSLTFFLNFLVCLLLLFHCDSSDGILHALFDPMQYLVI